MVHSAGSALMPARTESPRCVPPGTMVSVEVVGGVESTIVVRSRRKSGGLAAKGGGRTSTTWPMFRWEVNGRSALSTMGIPPIGRNCFGVSLPKRVPLPPAATTAPTSRGKRPHQLIYVVQSHQRRTRNLHRAPGRAEHPREAKPHGFSNPALSRATGSDLATEADLTQEDHVRRRGAVVQAGQEC